MEFSCDEIVAQVRAGIGQITLNRARALNALSLDMIRAMTSALRAWRQDDSVVAVIVRGSSRDPQDAHFGHFCAGGDIRFFHQAALAGDPRLEDFFTEEYTLNHLIHQYPKPCIALMDGVVMGGGMGISQGARRRIVTERSRLAMPETNIGLFPDVGGGWFLSRCKGHLGEYLALTGLNVAPQDAIACGLADRQVAAAGLPALWEALPQAGLTSADAVLDWIDARSEAPAQAVSWPLKRIDSVFGLPDVRAIIDALECADDDWSRETASALRQRSPLMLHVTLEQIRRARGMSLAEDLRMERDLVRQCFHLRPGAASETVEGIRALAVDKDHQPRWNPARIEDVSADQVAAFFRSPWPAFAHPLRELR